MTAFLLHLKRFCGFIVGIVFFLSGIVKLIDPVGAGLVMDEYYSFLHLDFLSFSSKFMGTLFALVETLVGAALITGVWRRLIAKCALGLQIFFTVITLFLVIFNPQMDCGCFGEAIHLTHMETFLKNIVLCILLCAYYFPEKLLGIPLKHKYVPFAVVTASVLAFTVYSWMYIPLVDYTDYRSGALLKAAETDSETDADMYEAVFIYEKDGKEEAFELEHLPDSTWNFVRTATEKIADYDTEGLIDLSFYNEDGEYMDSLAADGRVMVVSVYDTDISDRRWKEISEFIHNAEEAGFRPLLLISNSFETSVEIPEAYIADYKTLLAMNRSNGGVTYFSDGYLIRKWAFKARPDMETLSDIQNEDETETVIYHNTKGSLAFQGFLLYVFAVMLLL